MDCSSDDLSMKFAESEKNDQCEGGYVEYALRFAATFPLAFEFRYPYTGKQ